MPRCAAAAATSPVLWPFFTRLSISGAKGRVRFLTRDEADRPIDAAAPHLQPLLVFLLNTGARLGEALALDWAQVDLVGRRAIFLDTKNGESRGVPLNGDAFEALANIDYRLGIRMAGGGAARSASAGSFEPNSASPTRCVKTPVVRSRRAGPALAGERGSRTRRRILCGTRSRPGLSNAASRSALSQNYWDTVT
ncbi:MAG: tyrosine-type recombinase/integrase [Aliidongia sp.]